MNQTKDFEELDWTENPSNVGFGPDAAVINEGDELDFELGWVYQFYYDLILTAILYTYIP